MIVIGTPTTGTITARTTESLCHLIAYESKVGADVEFKPLACTFLPQARTQLIQHAMQRRASHLLFIDGDMTFPANALTRLFEHGEMVVGANYRRRSSHGHKFTATTDNQPVDSVGKTGLEAVDFLGLGVCLIDLQVFRGTLAEQWFPGTLYQNEDVAFCRLVRSLGYSVFVDHDLSQHVGHQHTGLLMVNTDARP